MKTMDPKFKKRKRISKVCAQKWLHLVSSSPWSAVWIKIATASTGRSKLSSNLLTNNSIVILSTQAWDSPRLLRSNQIESRIPTASLSGSLPWFRPSKGRPRWGLPLILGLAQRRRCHHRLCIRVSEALLISNGVGVIHNMDSLQVNHFSNSNSISQSNNKSKLSKNNFSNFSHFKRKTSNNLSE